MERINTELDRFVYVVTHDLKAPLANLEGLISIAGQEKDPLQIKEYCGLMNSIITKMKGFIDDLIEYSRNANQEILLEEVDLKFLLEEALEDHRFMENSEKIEFKVIYTGKSQVNTDRSRLRIVFNNLISNAIKYHDLSKKKPYVNIYASVVKGKVVVNIEDNGTGIEENEATKIFDMFYRASSVSSESTGSGIGLYILNEALKKIGGKISVKSSLGIGTIFTVEIN